MKSIKLVRFFENENGNMRTVPLLRHLLPDIIGKRVQYLTENEEPNLKSCFPFTLMRTGIVKAINQNNNSKDGRLYAIINDSDTDELYFIDQLAIVSVENENMYNYIEIVDSVIKHEEDYEFDTFFGKDTAMRSFALSSESSKNCLLNKLVNIFYCVNILYMIVCNISVTENLADNYSKVWHKILNKYKNFKETAMDYLVYRLTTIALANFNSLINTECPGWANKDLYNEYITKMSHLIDKFGFTMGANFGIDIEGGEFSTYNIKLFPIVYTSIDRYSFLGSDRHDNYIDSYTSYITTDGAKGIKYSRIKVSDIFSDYAETRNMSSESILNEFSFNLGKISTYINDINQYKKESVDKSEITDSNNQCNKIIDIHCKEEDLDKELIKKSIFNLYTFCQIGINYLGKVEQHSLDKKSQDSKLFCNVMIWSYVMYYLNILTESSIIDAVDLVSNGFSNFQYEDNYILYKDLDIISDVLRPYYFKLYID